MLALAAGLAAAILLASVAALTGSAHTGRAQRGHPLRRRNAARPGPGPRRPINTWVLAGSIAMLGAFGLLVLGVRESVTGRTGQWTAWAAGGLTVVIVVVVGAVAVALPGLMPPAWLVTTLDVVAWSGAGAAGIIAIAAGAKSGRALVRRTGIAFATLSAAHAIRIIAGMPPGSSRGAIDSALELTAVAMLLVAAVAFFVAVLRGLRTPTATPAPAPPHAVARPDERQDAIQSVPGSVTVGPVTDGIRILTPALAAGIAAEGHNRAGGPPRRWSRTSPHRRGRPDRGRPPGRARD